MIYKHLSLPAGNVERENYTLSFHFINYRAFISLQELIKYGHTAFNERQPEIFSGFKVISWLLITCCHTDTKLLC